ncbi:MAG: LamG domain-containing protein [Pirellulaceae bacterium]
MDIHDAGNSIDTMSLLAWIHIGHDPDDDEEMRIVTKARGDNHYWTLSLVDSNNGWRLRFRLKAGHLTKTVTANSSNLRAGQWYFLAATYDTDNIRLFVNGNRVAKKGKSGRIARNASVRAAIGGDPEWQSARWRYLQDLEQMHTSGLGDLRPFDGPVDLPSGRTPAAMVSRVEQILNVATNEVNDRNSVPLTHPGDVATYQIYPGGKVYYAKTLGATLANTKLAPDVLTNPLGIYYRLGAVTLLDNVSIQGTIITSGSSMGPDLTIDGTNIHLSAVDLPSLDGDDQVVQLPAAIVKDDFIVTSNARASTLRGMVLTWDAFLFQNGTDRSEFTVEGRLLVDELRLENRNEWSHHPFWWADHLCRFLAQVNDPEGTAFFPLWLQEHHGLDPNPKLIIQPEASPVTYHWQNWSQPLFVRHAADQGLVWELIEWKDNP